MVNVTNLILILSLSKYPVFNDFHPQPHVYSVRDNNNKLRCFILHISGQDNFCIGVGSRNKV